MIKDVHINNPKPLLKAIEFRVDAAHSRGASELMDILEAVVAGKVRETAIEREVGDSVLYHSLIELARIELASVGSIWSEMATEPRESHNVLEADFWPGTVSG